MSIKLVRIDFRLVHGQIVTKWIHTIKADTILVVNDKLAKDSFMLSVYQMSAPPGTKVKVVTVDDFIQHWKETRYEELNCMILIKNVDDAYRIFKGGVVFDAIQIGGLGGSAGRKAVFGPITLDKVDAERLSEINDSGQRVYFHQVPEDGSAEFDAVMKNVKFDE
ncbi:PTS sugar transporter subunit IIB [Faecalicoccus pleomorphus]|uniref:PTS sugar transporter subunit IIB n=1 Tax=Faecalicoccus pleomorphus TaxID=1323 RepID=UPI00242C87C8|nr:PTS sugar transporter subunit IIB [Faecalicoccus pleomorphus]